jgi:hypothetical protein
VTDVDLYEAQQRSARVGARAQILDVRLLKTSAEIDRLPSGGLPMSYRLDTEPAVEYDDGDGSFVVRAAYALRVVEVTPDGADEAFDDAEASVARINFELAALFTLAMRDGDEPVELEELQAYAASTGQFALYPYAREYIYATTGRMALPPLTVGVLQLPVQPD